MRRVSRWLIVLLISAGLCACGQRSDESWQEQYDLGMRYLSEGNYEEAIIAFISAIEIDPGRAEAYLSLADAYAAIGDAEQTLDALRAGWEACGEDSRFIQKLEPLGYGIDENGQIAQTGSGSIIQELYQIIYPDSYADGFLTTEQMWEIYDPIIPDLTDYIAAYPKDPRGYRYLGEIYVRLKEMDLCLKIRKEGYDQTGVEDLYPGEYQYMDEAGGQYTADAWGRLVSYISADGTVHFCEYGDGYELIRDGERERVSEYAYIDGQCMSRISYSVERGYELTSTADYSYPEPGVCVIAVSDPFGRVVETRYAIGRYGDVARIAP